LRTLTSGEITNLINFAEESFFDTCTIYVFSGTQDSNDGEVIASYTTVSGVNCGFHPTKSFKNYKGEIIIPEYQAELRIPLTQSIKARDEVLVKDTRYSIDGINKGITVTTLFLKELDT